MMDGEILYERPDRETAMSDRIRNARLNASKVSGLAVSMGLPVTNERFAPRHGAAIQGFAWIGLHHSWGNDEWVACAFLAETATNGCVIGLKPEKLFLHGALDSPASVHKASAVAVPSLLNHIDPDIPVVMIVPSQACLQHYAKLLERGRRPQSQRAGSLDWSSFDQRIEGRDITLIHAFNPMSELLS